MPANKNGYVSSCSNRSETVGSDRKKVVNDSVSPPQNKTPNKSGLTPIRPTKSPGTGMKLKSGLTPVRPGVSQGPAKSPFSQKPKLKSGLQPIKPNVQTQQVDEFNCSTFIARRKSGLKPIKPGGTLPYYPSQAKNDTSALETKPFTFAAPKHIPKGEKSSDAVLHGLSRRKSGLAPLKQTGFGAAPDRQSSWKPRSSMSHSSSVQGLVHSARKTCKPVESTPSLNVINEDSESNVSGICQLDDSADMSVVLRPRTGKRLSSRIPLPRATLDNAHYSSSELTKTRIPKRVLYFPDDDDKEWTHSNILKDGSSKANIVDRPSTINNDLGSENLHSLSNKQADDIDREEKSLLHRKKEIENAIHNMSSELKEIDEQLRILQDKRKHQSTHAFENNKQCEDEADSPFAHVEEDSVATNSTSNEDLAQLPAAEEFVSGAKKLLETKNPIRDLDEAALELGMSGSYSEILSPSHFKTEVVPVDDAKPSIQNLAVEGTVVKEGDMIHFIAKNLESKIRLSSPDISEASQIVSQSELAKHGLPIATPESTFLAQLERDARSIAASVDGLTEHLAVSLHTISAVTAQSLTVYKDSVCKTCDAMDSNIKSMYQLMAKCEELSKAMTPIYKLADQVKEIKKLLDIMENLS
ncbi:uncharacterized protein LOC130687343 [Daphnia carinata]|uniref:uncharacterized protein LOC130687343 n=1 Tax=Daphnia carinata TaxID=120202 RepID=UPI002579BF3E|nr:uncharacterized protein LOC130687343 [Daphnia carinata]